jgi:hypothetical protein
MPRGTCGNRGEVRRRRAEQTTDPWDGDGRTGADQGGEPTGLTFAVLRSGPLHFWKRPADRLNLHRLRSAVPFNRSYTSCSAGHTRRLDDIRHSAEHDA